MKQKYLTKQMAAVSLAAALTFTTGAGAFVPVFAATTDANEKDSSTLFAQTDDDKFYFDIAGGQTIQKSLGVNNTVTLPSKVFFEGDIVLSENTYNANSGDFSLSVKSVVQTGSNWEYHDNNHALNVKKSDFKAWGTYYIAHVVAPIDLPDTAAKDLVGVGYTITSNGFSGSLTFWNTKLSSEGRLSQVLRHDATGVKSETLNIDFSALNGDIQWGKKYQTTYQKCENGAEPIHAWVGNNSYIQSKVTIDSALYQTLATSENKFVVRASIWQTSGYNWREGTIQYLSQNDFHANSDGSYTADMQSDFSSSGDIKGIAFEVFGTGVKGQVTFSDAKFYSIEENYIPSPVDPTPSKTTSVAPTVPSETTASVAPTVPSETTASVAPTVPSETTASVAPTTPSETTVSVAPTVPSETTASVAPTVPSETTASVAPTVPSETTTSVAPTVPSETTASVAPTTPSETTASVAPTVPSETTTSVAPTVPSETTVSVAPTVPSETTVSVAPTVPSETTASEAPTAPSETTVSVAPTAPSETTASEAPTVPSETTSEAPTVPSETTSVAPTTPVAPDRVTKLTVAPKRTTSSLTLTWKAVANANSYVVQRFQSNKLKWSTIATVNATTYTDKKLKAGTTYAYRVCAVRKSADATVNGKFTSVKATTLPSRVTSFKAQVSKKKQVKLTIRKSSGAAGYQVYRSQKKNSGYRAVGTTNSSVFLDKKVKAGKTYYYKIVAYRKAVDGVVKSSVSNAKKVTIK